MLLWWPRQVEHVRPNVGCQLADGSGVGAHREAGALAKPFTEKISRLSLTQLLLQHLLIHLQDQPGEGGWGGTPGEGYRHRAWLSRGPGLALNGAHVDTHATP